jgi:Tfp pilus assembly protein PilO
MTKRTDKKIIITVSITVLVVAFFAWFSFFYETNQVKEIAETIQKKKLESIVEQEKRDKIALLKKELVDMESYKDEMEKMLIRKDDAVPLLRSLEQIASDTSTMIKIEAADLNKLKKSQQKNAASDEEDTGKALTRDEQIKADLEAEKANQEGSGKFKNSLGFTVELTGTFPAAVDYFDKMENLPYFITVYSMDISNSEKTKQVSASGGVLAAGSSSLNVNSENFQENKNVKTTMLIIVGTSDGN